MCVDSALCSLCILANCGKILICFWSDPAVNVFVFYSLWRSFQDRSTKPVRGSIFLYVNVHWEKGNNDSDSFSPTQYSFKYMYQISLYTKYILHSTHGKHWSHQLSRPNHTDIMYQTIHSHKRNHWNQSAIALHIEILSQGKSLSATHKIACSNALTVCSVVICSSSVPRSGLYSTKSNPIDFLEYLR